jgi:hypothetical protein
MEGCSPEVLPQHSMRVMNGIFATERLEANEFICTYEVTAVDDNGASSGM